MNKFSKAIKALGLIIRYPYLLNHIIDNESVWAKYVSKKYNLPNGLPLVAITDLFPDFNETVNPYAYLDGATLPIDIALLKAIASKYKVNNYFEIGTWRGESVANVADIVSDCFSLNLPDNEIYELGKSDDYVKMHRVFSTGLKNVKHLEGNSLYFDFTAYLHQFDMVFIDGDHHYESLVKDTKTAFKLIKDESKIIVWHDYALEPETVRWSVMAGILDACPPEKRGNLYHISNTLCAVYINEKITSEWLKIDTKPKHYFEIMIKSQNFKSS
ncbi:MAG: class I SAM-dependent methyltransferase [Bacteroidetes bacterium]|nr:class I SAM-dependent methyltransferase [Bacteroidota bacterium]